jgi:AcrR family transcriptional regulator
MWRLPRRRSLSQPMQPQGAQIFLTFRAAGLSGVNEHSFREHPMNIADRTTTPDRSAEILVLIRSAFAEKGFDGASMQDLARAAGMSVGNFYRYFPSKDAIIAGMAAYDMAEMEADFAEIQLSDDPIRDIRAKIRDKIRGECGDDARLWAEITAAAMRKPEIAAISCGVEDLVARNMTFVVAQLSGLPVEDAQARFGVQVRFIIMLVKSAAMRRISSTDPDLEDFVLKTIDDTLNTILSAARE